MNIVNFFFDSCIVFKNNNFKDKRGSFSEVYNQKRFNKILNSNFDCKQINFICSKENSLRGLHYQKKPSSQKKILRVIEGKIFDVIVDIRKNSKTYGKYKSIILSEVNKKNIFIPEGFAHGYLTLSKKAKVEYLCSKFYDKKLEVSINWA